MNVTATPAPRSSIVLEVELPPERLARAIDEAARLLSRRNRIPGFRPGKAPRPILERVLGPTVVVDEAVEHLVQAAYRDAIVEQAIIPLTNADVEIVQAEEGQPLKFKATVQVRPEVELGDYQSYPFRPEIETTDDPRVDKVIDELRDQNATLVPVEDRGAENGDYAVIGYRGTRDGEAFEGGTAERAPLILGEERMIPGFEANVLGLRVGESKSFDITFPEDYGEASLAGQVAMFEVELRELRAKVLPPLDDDFATLLGDYADLAGLRTEIRHRLERNALDRARHGFADRIVEYAIANSTLELPDVLVEQEIEVVHDEFRSALARQGITYEAYLQVMAAGPKPDGAEGAAAERTPESVDKELHAEWRPQAEKRVKVLLVLSKIAEVEGIDVPESEIEAEVARARERYAGEKKLLGYFESERGQNYIRSSIRRTKVVETLVDRWLAAHPDHPALPHAEDDEAPSATNADRANASIGATDPGSSAARAEAEAETGART
jgi:trigger factor